MGVAIKNILQFAACGALVVAALSLTGCGTPPWAEAAPTAPSGSSSPAPSASESASASPTPVPTPVPNDLSTGSTQRTITAGPVTGTINYWSDLSMDRWTAAAVKPVSMSMTTTVTPNDGQKVYLQRARVTATPYDGDVALAPLSPQVDSSTVNPGYLVLSPYSYSQTFNVGEVPEAADRVVLVMQYDFLVQTTPKSTEYAKQSASDRVTVAIAATPQ